MAFRTTLQSTPGTPRMMRTRTTSQQAWMFWVLLAGHPADVCRHCGAAGCLHGHPLPYSDKCKVKECCGRVYQQAYFKQHKATCKSYQWSGSEGFLSVRACDYSRNHQRLHACVFMLKLAWDCESRVENSEVLKCKRISDCRGHSALLPSIRGCVFQ